MTGWTSGGDGSGDGEDVPEPPHLRRLRRLVTALTATMIAGVITIVVLLVIRLSALTPPAAPPELPADFALPAGETARAVTFGTGWIAVVTVDAAGVERIRVLDAVTGAARGSLEIAHELPPEAGAAATIAD